MKPLAPLALCAASVLTLACSPAEESPPAPTDDLAAYDAADTPDIVAPTDEGADPDTGSDAELDADVPPELPVPPATGLGCSAPPEKALEPIGPLAPPMSQGRGVDLWEQAALEALKTEVLKDEGVHCLAWWDHELSRYVVEGQGARLEFVRGPNGAIEVLEGEVSALFPSTDATAHGDYHTYVALLENPGGMDHQALDYAEDDPRVGVLPAALQSYPLPMVRLAALFDAPDAPDVVGALLPWAYPSPGTHGAMSVLQSRSALVLSGAGVDGGRVLDEIAVLPDVVPTVLAALGAPTTGGMGPDGAYDDGLFVARQDGRVLWEALNNEPCLRAERVLIIDFDGLMATELNHLLLDDDAEVALPTMKALAAAGVVYRYGAVTNFPSVSAPGHMTLGTGLWSGHHGFVANAFYQRPERSVLNPFSLLTEIESILEDPQKAWDLYNAATAPGVETLADAIHRAFGPEYFTVVINEIAVGGADYTTVDYLTGQPVVLPNAAVDKYQLADALAVTQVTTLLQDPDVPVPTTLQLSFLATDGAGEAAGPHAPLVREMLVELDTRVQKLLDVYEQRGALDGTIIVLTADHGMELQDTTRPSGYQKALQASGVKLIQPMAGVVYFRTLEISAQLVGDGLEVTVLDHDNGAPVPDVTVVCGVCPDEAATTNNDGVAELVALPNGDPILITALHDGYNAQDLLLQL